MQAEITFRLKDHLDREVPIMVLPVPMIALAQFGRSEFIRTTMQEVKKIVDASLVNQCSHLGHVNSCFEWTHIVIENALANKNRNMCVEAWQKKCEGIDRNEIHTEPCGSTFCRPQCILTVTLVDLKERFQRKREIRRENTRLNQQRRREARL